MVDEFEVFIRLPFTDADRFECDGHVLGLSWATRVAGACAAADWFVAPVQNHGWREVHGVGVETFNFSSFILQKEKDFTMSIQFLKEKIAK